jgi:hypothetical protein
VTSVAVQGAGFAIANSLPTLPYTIAPGSFLDITVRFTAGPPAAYSANFRVNGTGAILIAASVAAPVLTVFPSCTIPNPEVYEIDFGRVQRGQFRPCSFTLRNPSAQAMPLNTLTVTGEGFRGPTGLSLPRILPAGEAVAFTLQFAPTAAALYSATLTVETRAYRLTGAGIDPPLPKPSFEWDAPPKSAEQRRLTLRFSAPASSAGRGTLNLSFDADSSLARDDQGIVFPATGTRSIPFSIAEGDTQALLNGQTSALIQTGTSAGRLRLSLAGITQGIDGDSAASFVIAPGAIAIDNAFGARQPFELNLYLVGFDNTYSAGAMTFQFYDPAGTAIPQAAIRADFAADFRTYFTAARAGSAFRISLSFPVTGDTSRIGAVDLGMTNSAGTVTRRIPFQ